MTTEVESDEVLPITGKVTGKKKQPTQYRHWSISQRYFTDDAPISKCGGAAAEDDRDGRDTVERGGDGNTVSPPRANASPCGEKNSRDNRDRKCVTEHALRAWILQHCSAATWSLEMGKGENNYLHWQIHLTLKKRTRITWMKLHFSPDAHIEDSRNIDAAMKYAVKADSTLVKGPYMYPEPVQNDIVDEWLGCTPLPWQLEIIQILNRPPDARKVHWYWEPDGNSGKSTFAKHLAISYGAYIVSGAGKDILFGVSKTKSKVIVLDIPRCAVGHVSYQAIESIKNGMFFSGKYESQMVLRGASHVIIFSNQEPDYTMLSADRWHVVRIDPIPRKPEPEKVFGPMDQFLNK